MRQYYHDQVTHQSWALLQNLQRRFDFILIGGWAVYLYTRSLKSKDIDIVVSLEDLESLKQAYTLAKNERLKKYEIKDKEVDVDIYVEYFSNPGLPSEDLKKYAVSQAGFQVPIIEALLVLKQQAWRERRGSAKGEKDQIDIVTLLAAGVDFAKLRRILEHYDRLAWLPELADMLKTMKEVPELGFNKHKLARLKKEWLHGLGEK